MYSDTKEEYEEQWKRFRALEIEELGFRLAGEGVEAEDWRVVDPLLWRFVNALSSQHDKIFEDYPLDVNNKFVRYLNRWPAGSRVLHLGCGTGREVLVGKSMGINSVGVTLGRRNVLFGKKILGLGDDEIILCPCEHLPFPEGHFDAVLGCQIFEHTVAPLVFLLEQGRVLKMGGEIVLEWPPASAHATNGFTPGQAWGLLMKAGFRDIKLFYNDMSPIPEASWWMGEQPRGYVIATAKKAPSDVDYIISSRKAWWE